MITAETTGPLVALHFSADHGGIASRHGWTTGLLVDGGEFPGGTELRPGVAFSAPSGQNWGIGWAVAWNVNSPFVLVQQTARRLELVYWMRGHSGHYRPAAKWRFRFVGNRGCSAEPLSPSATRPVGAGRSTEYRLLDPRSAVYRKPGGRRAAGELRREVEAVRIQDTDELIRIKAPHKQIPSLHRKWRNRKLAWLMRSPRVNHWGGDFRNS